MIRFAYRFVQRGPLAGITFVLIIAAMAQLAVSEGIERRAITIRSDGTPDLAKMLDHRPIDSAGAVKVPTLIIDVSEEELFDRMANGRAVYDIIRQNTEAEYKTYPG